MAQPTNKLPGRYKGNRPKPQPKVLVRIQCGACGWLTQVGPAEQVEVEYIGHLTLVHYGVLECAFCEAIVSKGISCHGTFEALANHVKAFHGQKFPELPEGAIPAHAFK